jgi:hypothetical protein
MHTHILRITFRLFLSLAAALSVWAPTASAYLTPEQVFYDEALYLPPRSGDEALERVRRQQATSALRRGQEQELIFGAQHPAAPEEEAAGPSLGSEPYLDGSGEFDVELLRTLRLLERAEERQRYTRYGGEPLHAGAPRPDLAPTGAPAILAAFAILIATVWTLRRARRTAKEEGVVSARGTPW